MSKKENVSTTGSVSAERLEQLEEKLSLLEKLRKKQHRASLLGILCILFFFGLFVYRIWSHINNTYVQPLQNPQARVEFVERIAEEARVQEIVQQELTVLMQQITEEVIPATTKQIAEDFSEASPEIKEAAEDMGTRLHEYAVKHVEDRLSEALFNSLVNLEKEIQEIFPDFRAAHLEQEIEKAKGLFIEQLTDVIEERLARVSSSLESLKGTVDAASSSKSGQGYTVERAEAEFIEAMVDLLVYELKPELGKEMVK